MTTSERFNSAQEYGDFIDAPGHAPQLDDGAHRPAALRCSV
jgi:hypothetical protein